MAQLSFLTYLRGIYKINLTQSSKVHYAIIQSIYDCFVMAQGDLNLMRLEMCLSTATGQWLDYWGKFFSIYRKSGELDENYAKRIIDSVIQPKSTIPAVKDNIIDYLNSEYEGSNYTTEDIRIKEPWKEVAKYSHKGTLSNTTRFFSGDYYCHAIMDISIPEQITKEVVDLVNSVKAAGVKIIWSVLNSYDIVTGYNTANDAWASYHRHVQTYTQRNQFSGLILSNSSPSPTLSGNHEIWFWRGTYYYWYAKIKDKETDESIIITKKDLIGLLDYYTEINESSNVKTLVKITNEMIESLELLDAFISLSYQGRISTSSGTMFEYLAEHSLFGKLIEELAKFKQEHPDYYDSVQPPILNGERAMWMVKRHENWLWNTPTITHKDFFELWEPMEGYEEHTINSIVEFEDAYYQGYITFGDKYQPLIVIGNKFRWTPILVQNRLWDSPAFCIEDLSEIYRRQFNWVLGRVDYPDPSIEDIELLEQSRFEGYSVAGEVQPPILNGERAMWYVESHKNWLWDTPTITYEDFFELWEPMEGYEEHTLKSIIKFEDTYYNGYITFGDMYQPPIEIKSTSVTST